MVNVTLEKQMIRDLHFVNHIDKSGQLQLSSKFNFHVNFTDDNAHCMAQLYQNAQMRDDPDKLFISVEIVGFFAIEGVVDEETKKDAHVQCYDQLFPFLQTVVSQTAAASGMPGFMLKKVPIDRENINLSHNPKAQSPMTLPIV